MPFPRFQFSILSIQLGIAYLAILLGIRVYIEPRVYWRDLWILLSLLSFYGLVYWLFGFAPWTVRFFAIGFVIGAAFEFLALDHFIQNDLVVLSPGVWTPEGWYPFTLPWERTLVARGWAGLGHAFPMAMLGGMVLSGILFGFVLSALWLVVRRVLRRRAAEYQSQAPERTASC